MTTVEDADPDRLTTPGRMRRFTVTTVLGETFVYHCETFGGREDEVSFTMQHQPGDIVFLKLPGGRLVNLAHVVHMDPLD